MSELERELTALGAEVEWPETPAFELRLEPAAPRRSRRRGLVLVLALVAVAIGIAFAVPPARSAILDLLHLGGVTVERVQTLPAAEERALGADLGRPVTRGEAEEILGGPVRLPRMNGKPRLYEREGVISAVLAAPEPVLVSELRPPGGGALLKKVAGMAGTVESARSTAGAQGSGSRASSTSSTGSTRRRASPATCCSGRTAM